MRAAIAVMLLLVACGGKRTAADPSDVAVASAKGKRLDEPKPCDPAGQRPPLDAQHAEGLRLVDVCVVGASSETVSAVRQVLNLRADRTLGAEPLRRDLDAAYATGLVDQIEATARASGNGAVLWLTVQERPRIAALAFDGLDAAKDDPILAAFPKAGDRLNRTAIFAASEKLREHYADNGWDEATVDHAVSPDARVTVRVHEGTRAKVGKITFDGAKGGRDAGLRKLVELDEGAPLAADRLERAALLVNAFYYDNGFLQVKVDPPKRTRAADGTTAITFPITEGPVFRIGKLRVRGTDATTEKEILASLKTKSGEVFKRSKVIADIDAIRTRARQSGKVLNVEPETELDTKKGTVDLTLAIAPL